MLSWSSQALPTITLLSALVGATFSPPLRGFSLALVILIIALEIRKVKGHVVSFLTDQFGSIIPLLLALLYGILISERRGEGVQEAKTAMQLLVLPVFALISLRVKHERLLVSLFMVNMVEFALAIYKYVYFGFQDGIRMHGVAHFNTDAFFCMLSIMFFLRWVVLNGYNILALSGIAINAVFLFKTESRTSIIIIILLLWPLCREISTRAKALISLGVCLFLVIPLVLKADLRYHPWTIFKTTMEERGDDKASTSMGTRYQLWKAAGLSFMETNGVGTGYGDFRHDLDRMQEDGLISKDLNSKLHLHNSFLQSLMCAGLPGFLGLLYFFFHAGRKCVQQFRQTQLQSAHFKFLLLASLFMSCMVDSQLDDGDKIFYFAFIWALAASLDGRQDVSKQGDLQDGATHNMAMQSKIH